MSMTSSLKCVEKLFLRRIKRRELLLSTPPLLFGFYCMNKYLTKNFTVDEFKCRGTGICDMNQLFMEKLQLIREEFGKPLYPSSGFRAPEYNQTVSKTGLHGPHTTGHAVDILICGSNAIRLMEIALRHGITGIGVSQKNDHATRFLHFDDLTGANRPKSGKRNDRI